MIQFYSSLTKQKEPLKPKVPGKLGFYVCGITVYDLCHVGHARVMVCFDAIVRYLRYRGFDVTYVQNITDIDDKIINRANENNEDYHVLTQRYTDAMHEDMAVLGVERPDQQPKATEHLETIVKLIQRLVDKGYAYVAENNDVYYEVTKFAEYGKLSHRDLDDEQAGARVAIGEVKKNPLDFVLWKSAKPDEPSWQSPWGPGRPGWHIECSAMSMHCLGENFDIHGGGYDLLFPHHENEIAQSEAATGKPFVNTWLHLGYVTINKEKMSKSLGNFFTIREVLKEFRPEVLRYFLVSAHYRSPINFSQESLKIAEGALERFYIALRGLPKGAKEIDEGFEERFIEAMDDDFNTPEGLAVLFDLVRAINRYRQEDENKAAGLGTLLRRLGGVLGILQDDPENFLQHTGDADSGDVDVAKVEALIAARNQARQDKDWAKADEIRDKLAEMGIVIEDGAGVTTWRKA